MKPIKIGVLNFQHSDQNYGAVLQAAALQSILASIGQTSEHINLIPQDRTLFRRFLQNSAQFTKSILGIIESAPKSKEVFESFRIKYINRTKNTYRSNEDLKNEDFHYDAVIVGSDQVWRPPTANNLLESYFLSFAKKDVKKIAYAASFGVDYWPKENDAVLTEKVSELAKRFHRISTREDTGVEICKRHFDVEANQVLDPVLAVGREFFQNIISNEVSEPNDKYADLVYYKLDIDNTFLTCIDEISDAIDYSAENIYYLYKGKSRYYNSVPDWLSKIRNSNLVITDSFHAVCIAILFNKEFICCANKRRGLARLESLLKMLKIENRIHYELDSTKIKNILNSPIDYIKTNSILETKRVFSIEFLKNALENSDE